jgi:hypothetical protein
MERIKAIIINISNTYPAMILISVIVTGCSQSINLGLIETGLSKSQREFYVDTYRIQIRILQTTDEHEYIYSLSIFDTTDGKQISNVKSNLAINKYIRYPNFDLKHSREERKYITSGLEPFRDSSDVGYDYKYLNHGKYQVILKISKIAGEPLSKVIYLSFDQNVL